MKRYGNLYEKVIAFENLDMAERKSRKGKESTRGVMDFDKDRIGNLQRLHEVLAKGEFKTSPYRHMTIMDKKKRLISILPYYPDRIVHHAVMNVLEELFMKKFTTDTYQCIKNRGIRACQVAVEKALKEDVEGTQYCLQIDIVKFYPSISHTHLKRMLNDFIKDKRLIALLFEIIDSTEGEYGIPIGNYISQYFANFYLSEFDHWMKENMKVKHYFRYADDVVVLGATKSELHALLAEMRTYLQGIELKIKDNYQVYSVDIRGIDFVGYIFRHTHILMRKSIKQNFARRMAQLNKMKHSISEKDYRIAISPWWGWCKYCNSKNLIKKLSKTAIYEIEF